MEDFAAISLMLSDVMAGLALGVEMFGDHAIWLWILPPVWIVAIIKIENAMEKEQETLDRLYAAEVEKNVPRLNELLKQRSTEIIEIKPVFRDDKQ